MDLRGKAETVVESEPVGTERAPVLTALGRFEARGPFLYRGAEKFYAKGVTYGPFRPNAAGEPFPAASRVRTDFSLMRSLGVNAARLYDVPPPWFADLAAHAGISLLAGIPWSEHVCALTEAAFRREVHGRVRRAVMQLRDHPAVLGVLVGNEIPSSNVRWTGPRVVERFLRDLFETARSADPRRLVSYANYPPTEYLRLEAFDFFTLNVYLHDRGSFSRYLAHMRNLAGDRPFLIGEFGIDVQREGEERQAEILKFSLEEAFRAGVAGTFVFSFTDEWFRGGNDVTGWSFGLTDRERRRRPAARAVAEVLAQAPEVPLERTPRVSVVVATYNGARTLRETLESLGRLRYPDYEVIVIDDGSTDDSASIAGEFLRSGVGNGSVRLIQQENRGLSSARNRGIEAATGEIVAFCDSDVAVDPLWLYHLVGALLSGEPGTEGVGGPNLPPPGDGWVAAAVSASPGTATQVLMGDEAEHVPGCNMAFWKAALVALGGFDPRFRAAGDDVDICWRIQNEGGRLAFAPSAIVWHHRRNSAPGYFRQQRGYGEAEADLASKHPDRYNWLGGALWRGRIYPYDGGRGSLRLRRPRIEYGVFGLGLFQRLYEPEGPRLATVAAMPEAALAGLLALAGGILSRTIALALPGAALLGATLAAALARALGARLAPEDAGPKTRALVFWLSLAQPWVRRAAQLRKAHRLYRARKEKEAAAPQEPGDGTEFGFWSESGGERTAFLGALERRLTLEGFPVLRGCPFDRFDLRVSGAPGARALASTVVEYHGGPKRLLRLRVRPVVSRGGLAALGLGVCAAGVLGAASLVAAGAAGLLLALAFAGLRRRALWLRRVVLARAAEAAGESGFAPVRGASFERTVAELKPPAIHGRPSGPEDPRSAGG